MTAIETTSAIQQQSPANGWVFYDGECSLCSGTAARFAPLLSRHHFRLAPLQTPWVQQRLGLNPAEPLMEMKLLAADGRVLGGLDALLHIARRIWWVWPLFAVAQIPGMKELLRVVYRWMAANRQCLNGACRWRQTSLIDKAAPLVVLPVFALCFRNKMPAWIFMWAIAFALFAGCKWLTFSMWRAKGGQTSRARELGYLLAWPGMDAAVFLAAHASALKPRLGEWLFAATKIIFGVMLVWLIARLVAPLNLFLAAWVGMIGVVLILHFGLFHLLSLAWRMGGVNATPVMRNPALAASLAEFWGRRWNTAFHELVHRFTFRPCAKLFGVTGATLMVFLLSGVVHELCISLPAHGGYGLPTGYFLIQGLGVITERTPIGRRLRLGHGACGRLFAITAVMLPVFWLFHPLFVRNVTLPMFHAIGAI